MLLARQVKNEPTERKIAQGLLDVFRAPFGAAGQRMQLGASIGFCLYPQDGDDATTLLRRADSAMYRVKATGQGGYRYVPDDADNERLELLKKTLGGACERGEFSLVYQPLYSLQSRKVVKVEALLRWQHPVYGEVSPGLFIALAEANDQIIAIGK